MLSDAAIERYARQIVLPGLGATGQEKLLAATVLVAGGERGRRQAGLYLAAAGARVIELMPGGTLPSEPVDLAVVADVDALDAASRALLLRSELRICWYALDAGGFTSGVHPGAPLPEAKLPSTGAGAVELHDAAACDLAGLASAIVAGLPWRCDAFRFDVAAR